MKRRCSQHLDGIPHGEAELRARKVGEPEARVVHPRVLHRRRVEGGALGEGAPAGDAAEIGTRRRRDREEAPSRRSRALERALVQDRLEKVCA